MFTVRRACGQDHLDEPRQAEALRIAYEEASGYDQVEDVFWWYSNDINTYVGLMRRDESLKASWRELARLSSEERAD